MQLPVKPYYTISSFVLLQQYEDAASVPEESVRLNILLDIPRSRLPVLFSLLGTIKNNYIFSLPASLVSDHDMLQEMLPACYILTSLDNFSVTGEPIIPILWDYPARPDNIDTGLIDAYFYSQDIKNLQLPLFSYQQAGIQKTVSCSFFVYDINQRYDAEPVFPVTTIISFTTEIRDLATFNHCISHIKIPADKMFSDNYIEKKIFQEEIQHWQERAFLYKNFLVLSKSVQEKEYYEVLNWYHKEYEALPLWYKRFGHIIKVIMGKRSFRSLFNDNIKKSKN